MPSKEKIAAIKSKSKHLVVIDGQSLKNGYRLKVYGGIVKGIQVLDFPDKDGATMWLMGYAFGFYMKAGKTVRPSLK